MEAGSTKLQLRVPQQDLRNLSFCGHTSKNLEAWVESLPKVNVGETARLLYSAIQELNRLQLDPTSRFHLLEILRPSIHYVCKSLSKHYLNQSIVLPDRANKVANLAQALQNHLAIGYKIVVVQGIHKIKENNIAWVVASAIHRALSDLCCTLLRCYELYFPTPSNLWRELHRLYLLAEHNKLLGYEVEDEEIAALDNSCIHHVYLRALLVATSKPNQLRQKEINLVYSASEVWSRHCKITVNQDSNHLFVANLMSDSEPIYASLVAKKEKNQYYRFINCSPLATQLQDVLRAPDHFSANAPFDFYIPVGFNDDLLRHLIQAWGKLTQRSFSRAAHHGKINICLGLSATHYYVADKNDFDTVLRGFQNQGIINEPENPFLSTGSPFQTATSKKEEKGVDDVWAYAFDAGGNTTGPDKDKLKKISLEFFNEDNESAESTDERPRYDAFICRLANTSPGGFCISWKDHVPTHVKTGEIIGVKEDNQLSWSIGVIRWVKQFKNEGARMGIELLAPNAIPVGTKVLHKTGAATEYMRALLLPELKAIGQPATLITPKIAFHVGNKILLNENGEEDKAQLIKQITSTASFSQFQFKFLTKKQPGPKKSPPKKQLNQEDDFDSIWSSL